MNEKRQKKRMWRSGNVRRNMQRVLASILCIVLVLGGIYVPGMTVWAAERDDLSSWDALDVSGREDNADHTESQPVLFSGEEGDIASGTYENITWRIDADGKLTVEGTGEFAEAGEYYHAPWYDQRDKIKTAVICITGLKNASNMFYGCNNLTSLNLSGFDTSNVTAMWGMFYGCSSLTSLDLSSFEAGNVTEMGHMFYGCSSLTSLDLRSFDTSNVTSMNGMFHGCSSMTSLDLRSFDTSNVTNMSSMFYGCSSMTSLDLSKFDTSNVMHISNMFDGCSNLTSLDLSSFDTHNVTDMIGMFGGCSSLTSLDLSSFETGNVMDMTQMFRECSSLTSLDLSSFDTGNVTDMWGMFYGCNNLTSLDLSSFHTGNVTNMELMFCGCGSLTSLDVSSFETGNVTDMDNMFGICSSLISLDVSGFETGNVTDMRDMFSGCSSLTSLDVSGFETGNVTDMRDMFSGCSSLTSLDVSGFATGNVTDMGSMFWECSSLTSLDVSGFATGNVTDMGGMFCGCSSLTNLELSGFETGNVTDMESMFWECSSLTSLDLSSFETGNVTNMRGMFCNCSNLTNLDLSSFDTGNVMNMEEMFLSCSGLTSLDLSVFDTNNVTNMGRMFEGCSGLTGLDLSVFATGNVMYMGEMFLSCSSLTSLDLSGFDTSNVRVMYSMFDGCSSLTSLDLSSFDMHKVTSMDYMLGGCTGLTLINTPCHLREFFVWLPSETWYRSDGSVVEHLPEDMSYSVVLQKDAIPTEKSQFTPDTAVPPDKSMLLIMETRLTSNNAAKPLSNAKVTVGNDGSSYITDNAGIITLSEKGKKEIFVEKEGYYSAKVTKNLAFGKTTIIYLYPLSMIQKILVISSTMNLTGEEQDIFNSSKGITLIHKDLSEVSDGVSKDFIIKVNATGSPEKYQLLQNGKVIQESTTGVFTIKGKQVQEKDNTYSNYVEDFEAGYKVSVRVLGADGKSTKHDLNIRVSESSSGSVKWLWDNNKASIELGDKLSITVPDNVPLYGGTKVELGLEEALPIDVGIDDTGKVRIAVNMKKFDTSDSAAWAEMKREYDNLAKRAKKASGAAQAFGGTPQSYGAGMFKIKGSVMGYGEGYWDEKANVICISVGMIIKVEGEADYTQYFFVGAVPFFIEFGGGASLTVSGKLNFNITEDGCFINGGSLELEPAIYAKLKGGVGADGLLSLSASGKVTLAWLHCFTPSYDRVSLNGNAKITGEAFCFSKDFLELDGTWVIYDSNQKSAPALFSRNSIANPDMSDAKIISMDYLDKRAAYSAQAGGAMAYSLTNAKASNRVLDYAYQNASPRLLQLGDKLYLFYLDGVEGRSEQNQTALFYQISSDHGATWSEASRVDDGANETADFHFDIATDGTDIYVIWSDAGAVYGEDFLSMDTTAALDKLGKELDLMLAVIDGGTGVVRSTSVIKTEAGDIQPQIYAGNDGAVTVAWITNDVSAADGLLSNANRMGICYASSTSDYQVQTLSLEDGQYPLTLAVGSLGTQVCIAAGLDTDGDLNTQDDRDIYIAYPDTDEQLSALTANESVDSIPFFGRVGGQDCLFWYQDGNMAYTSDGQTTHLILSKENRNSSGQDFSLLESSAGDGKAAVVWTATSLTEENGVDVYCADFDGETWSAPYRLGALDSEYTTHLDGWMDGAGYHLAYLGKEYTDDTLKAHICLDESKELIDTAVTWYPETEEHPGKSYPLQLVVMNNGNQTVKSLQISSKDGSIQEEITDLSIAPGTSEEVTWSGITLPEEMTELYTQDLTILADGETNAEDNTISLSLGAPDFSIDVYSDFASGDLYAGVIVTNSGILPSDAIIRIYQDSAHEQEIFSTGIRDIAGGESKLTLLDMAKLHEITPAFYFTVSDSKGMEIYTGDNEAFLYEGKGLWLEYDNGQGSEQPGDSVLQAEKTKTVYEYGDALNVDDLTVTLLGSDGTATETVTEYSTNADSIDMLTLGEKTLTVTYGEYSASVTLTVEPCTVKETNTVVTLPYTSCVYDGTAKEPLPKSVTVNGVELVYETDYTVSWSDNTDVGTAALIITGQGNYRGAFSVSFKITQKPEDETTYTVTFDLQGHGTLAPLTDIKAGSRIVEPTAPQAQGYLFTGWYCDSACTVLWKFDTDVVQENLTLYAGWHKDTEGGNSGDGDDKGDDKHDDGDLSIREIDSLYYTGSALKPAVTVYSGDGVTPLKQGKDYTIKYFNNIQADTEKESILGGRNPDGTEGANGFTKQLAYVVITGKGNYKGTVYQNFHIMPVSLSEVADNGDVDIARRFTLKYKDQLLTNTKKAQKPFTSLKYIKAMKAGKDYEVILTAVTAYDGTEKQLAGGSVVARSTETGALPAIPAGYHGSFEMRVTGIGNFTGSFEKAIYVTDKSHLLKNVSVMLGKNQKKTDYTGQDIVLRPGYYDASAKAYYAVEEDGTISAQAEPNGDNVFTVKAGKEYLLYGRDYTISYGSHRSVGKATMILTGKGDYAGSKNVTFQIKGSAFNAKTIQVNGLQAALNYTGKALTQSGVTLTDISTSKPLVSGSDYTVTYKNNLKKGKATMLFTAKPSSGYSGSFQKTFRITAAPLADAVKVTAVNTAKDKIVYEGTKIRLDGTVVYTREGAKPSGRIQLCNSTTGEVLKEGTDYTVTYQNNTTVTSADHTNQAVMLIKGKNNYAGTLQVGFRISAAVMAEQTSLKATAVSIAFNDKKAEDYEYRPTIKLMDGKKTLRAKTDYEVTYVNCTQKAVTAYLTALSGSALTGQSYEQMRPYARIEAKEGSGYQGSMNVDLTIYNTKITASNLYVVITPDARQTTYSGRQVTPEVMVYYGDQQAVKAAKQAQETSNTILTNAAGLYKLTRLTVKTDGTAGDYALLYGTNTVAGKNKGSITINGTGLYGGKVTVKFTINQRDVYSQYSPK